MHEWVEELCFDKSSGCGDCGRDRGRDRGLDRGRDRGLDRDRANFSVKCSSIRFIRGDWVSGSLNKSGSDFLLGHVLNCFMRFLVDEGDLEGCGESSKS